MRDPAKQRAAMPSAEKNSITNHVRSGSIGRRAPVQPRRKRSALDSESEVGQCDVGLQQGHGTDLGGELCRSA